MNRKLNNYQRNDDTGESEVQIVQNSVLSNNIVKSSNRQYVIFFVKS